MWPIYGESSLVYINRQYVRSIVNLRWFISIVNVSTCQSTSGVVEEEVKQGQASSTAANIIILSLLSSTIQIYFFLCENMKRNKRKLTKKLEKKFFKAKKPRLFALSSNACHCPRFAHMS